MLKDILKKKERVRPEKKDVEDAQTGLFNVVNKKRGTGRSAKLGIRFEHQIEDTCKLYRQMNVAIIKKFTPPQIFIPRKTINGKVSGGFSVPQKGSSGIDFIGGVIETGRAIFLECKSTQEGIIPVWQESSGIKTYQIEELWECEQAGFTAYFLWKIRNHNQVVKITPTQLVQIVGDKITGRKSLKYIDCQETRIPVIIPTIKDDLTLWDFLNVL